MLELKDFCYFLVKALVKNWTNLLIFVSPTDIDVSGFAPLILLKTTVE